jgi:hypothetical protein
MAAEHDPPRSPHSDEPWEEGAAAPASAGEASGQELAVPGSGEQSTDADSGRGGRHGARNMLPGRERRRLGLERLLVRLIATAGIVGIGVAIAAIMTSSNSQGWVIGVVVSAVSVVLSAILWSSRSV